MRRGSHRVPVAAGHWTIVVSKAGNDAGATAAEIVELLVGAPIVGLPRVVKAAPKLAAALGYDIEEALEQQSGG
jgi:hypothetical protein